MLYVNKIYGHTNQVGQCPGVSHESKLIICDHIEHTAGKDGGQGGPSLPGRPRLVQEQRLPYRNKQRHNRSEHYECVNIGMEEQLTVGEKRQVKYYCRRQKPPHCEKLKGVMLQELHPAAEEDPSGAGEVLQGG
ncbi:hypothetical protein V8G54_010464 [Vigna mungo]|uniref:Uncharacterized protein n=1 Tax=Vigna mungo TaxID=3915 RepID=A0AAQ3NZ49_VIGMU